MTERSVGYELWNSHEAFFHQISADLTVVDDCHNFLNECNKLQENYGKKLRKVATSYSKGDGESDMRKCLNGIVQTFQKIGTDLEEDAHLTNDRVLLRLKTLSSNLKKNAEITNETIEKLCVSENTSQKNMGSSWLKYFESFRQLETATNSCNRDKKTLSKADLRKIKDATDQKRTEYASCMKQYAADIKTHNDCMDNTFMKKVVLLDDLDVKFRNCKENYKELLLQLTLMKQDVAKEIVKCFSSIHTMFSDYNLTKDHQQMLEKFADSKMRPPALNLIRLDLVNPHVLKDEPHLLAAQAFEIDDHKSSPLLSQVGKGGWGKRNDQLRSPFFFDIGLKPIDLEEMPIVELEKRIQTSERELAKFTKQLVSLQHLLKTSKNYSKMGDNKTILSNIDSCERCIVSISFQRNRLQTRLEQLGGENRLTEAKAALVRQRKEWEDSVQAPQLTGSKATLDSDPFGSDTEEPVPPASQVPGKVPGSDYVGTATALFSYDGGGSRYPSFKERQCFHVVEVDSDNTGWTAVVFEDGSTEGFVPTNYIKVTLF